MTKKPVPGQREKESLLPAVEKEEDRLRAYLDQARADARRIVEDAERAAAEKTRLSLEDLPRLMEKRRAEMLETHREEAAALRARLSAETVGLLRRAERNLEDAISLIVSLVWPGDPP